MNQNRQPAGVPTGGQFAVSAHVESGVALADQPLTLDARFDRDVDLTYAELDDVMVTVRRRADAPEATRRMEKVLTEFADKIRAAIPQAPAAVREDMEEWAERIESAALPEDATGMSLREWHGEVADAVACVANKKPCLDEEDE